MDDADIPLYQHCVTQMQYLLVDSAHQRRNHLTTMPIRDDGWISLDQLGTHYGAPCAVQANRKVLENYRRRNLLAYAGQDLLHLCSSW
jgi:hypothetical protein